MMHYNMLLDQVGKHFELQYCRSSTENFQHQLIQLTHQPSQYSTLTLVTQRLLSSTKQLQSTLTLSGQEHACGLVSSHAIQHVDEGMARRVVQLHLSSNSARVTLHPSHSTQHLHRSILHCTNTHVTKEEASQYHEYHL